MNKKAIIFLVGLIISAFLSLVFFALLLLNIIEWINLVSNMYVSLGFGNFVIAIMQNLVMMCVFPLIALANAGGLAATYDKKSTAGDKRDN